MKTETLKTVTDPRRINTHGLMESMVDISTVPENVFREFRSGEKITLPTNYLGSEELLLPSLEVVTPRGNEARLVSLHTSDNRLSKMYQDTIKARRGLDRRIDEMTYDAAVRILDTSGAEGLHHIHGTDFPHTIYHVAKRGNGILPNVYVTRLGVLKSGVPVLGRITATRDKKAEYDLFNRLGAGSQKRKRTP